MILCFEGINGAGKSTQFNMLRAAMDSCGIRHFDFFDPGVSDQHPAQELRRLFLTGDRFRDPKTSLLVGFAARNELTYEIRAAQKEDPNAWILLDRYQLSTYAYQALMLNSAGIDIPQAEHMISELGRIIDIVSSDALVLFDTPCEVAYARRGGSRRPADAQADDQFESRGLTFSRNLRDRYMQGLANSSPVFAQHWYHINVNASDTPADVYRCWVESVSKEFPELSVLLDAVVAPAANAPLVA